MQTAIHDPKVGLTPTQRKELAAHRDRLARLRGAAVSATDADDVKVSPSLVPETKSDPPLTMQGWVDRQKEIHASESYKPLWFSIEDDVAPTPAYPRIEEIQRVVSLKYDVSRSSLLSSRRTADVVRPRQVAMYLAKTLTLRSLPEIGRRFGGRDHTTVLHAVRKIEALVGKDSGLLAQIETIKQELEAAQ